MQTITLQMLLEAGCHFGHKSERWHPKASEFIYTKKDGIHVIDLAKTKAGLEAAMAFIYDLASQGSEVLFVATKRQAKNVVREAVVSAGAPYFVERWIGGFMTNWDGIHKNIVKVNRMITEQETDAWKQFPKHEQVQLARHLARLKMFYGGVLALNAVPAALFVVDVKKEIAAVREAQRRGIPVVAIVDTNADPSDIDYVIPANDDAVGSIQCITHAIVSAYTEGKEVYKKNAQKQAEAEAQALEKAKQEAAKAKEELAKPQVQVPPQKPAEAVKVKSVEPVSGAEPKTPVKKKSAKIKKSV